MNNPIPIAGPLSLGDLLDRAFRLYRARFTQLLLTAAVILVPYSLLSGLFSGRFITGYLDALQALASSPDAVNEGVLGEMFGAFGSFFGGTVVLAILGLIFNGVVTLALISQTIALLHDEPQSMGASFRRGLRRFVAYAVQSIVQFVAVLFATFAVLIPLFLLVAIVAFVGSAIGVAAFSNVDSVVGGVALVLVILCGYLLILVLALAPGIYLSARWIAAAPTLLAEELGAMESLRRSWSLTQGHIWRAVGYLVLLSVITAVVVSLPVSLIQQVLILALPSTGVGLVTGISSAISSIFTVVWTPFYAAATVLLYYDLRVRSEGYDLDLRIQQLESQIAPRPSLPAQEDDHGAA